MNFVRFTVGGAEVVCAEHVADGVRAALGSGSLYRFAERAPDSRRLAGRGVVYAVQLPHCGERIVVRHNHHGGMFAALTRDVFRPPTRAPHELATSERLHDAGVPTPMMLGYVTYRTFANLVRVDVFSREIPDSVDLSSVLLAPQPHDIVKAWSATRRLVRALAEAGVRHHDLNVKNILLQASPTGTLDAYVLDVDRVEFTSDRDAANEANIARLMRSAHKWRRQRGAAISEQDLEDLETLLRRAQPASSTRA